MAEMRRIRIADILRQMREIDILVDEVQQMARPLPGAEGTERHAGLLLEQMQEARLRQPHRRRAFGRVDIDVGKFAQPRDGLGDALVECAGRERLAEEDRVEFAGGESLATPGDPQRVVSATNPRRDRFAGRTPQPLFERQQRRRQHRFRLDHHADDRGIIALDAVHDIGRHHDDLASGHRTALGDAEFPMQGDIDIQAAAGPLQRLAEQPGVKHPLRTDKHQMLRCRPRAVVHAIRSRDCDACHVRA